MRRCSLACRAAHQHGHCLLLRSVWLKSEWHQPCKLSPSFLRHCREGISELRPWQASCLSLPGVMPLEGEQDAAQPDPPPCNLVFSGGARVDGLGSRACRLDLGTGRCGGGATNGPQCTYTEPKCCTGA